MINPDRLKILLQEIVERLIPHKKDCNLNPDIEGRYGMGCTCGIDDLQDRLKKDIDNLEKESDPEGYWRGTFIER